jgi:hypothetical protein
VSAVHPLTPYPPLLINAALTGMVGRRADVPHLSIVLALDDLDHEQRTPATNSALVQRVVVQAQAVGRRAATPEQARALLGLALPEPEPAGAR